MTPEGRHKLLSEYSHLFQQQPVYRRRGLSTFEYRGHSAYYRDPQTGWWMHRNGFRMPPPGYFRVDPRDRGRISGYTGHGQAILRPRVYNGPS